jgi:hypothetical protein
MLVMKINGLPFFRQVIRSYSKANKALERDARNLAPRIVWLGRN